MYFQGIAIPVMAEHKQADLDMAKKAAPIFAEHGAMRTVECWGDDVMDGKIPDFRNAIRANDNENVVFSGSGGLTRRRVTRRRRKSWPTSE
jgi:uncharacterized protein YbaA (DUF1428 family)